ncbi:MAG TPA: apolipoprotein N-acyltransferase [Verrucomicrobiae bacterium]|nr:apolipoprotein N-acyltransferase [Verrucomicrobiae bacterium]
MQGRHLLAIVAGLFWAASFPKIGIAGLAWIAPGLMLLAAIGKRGGQAFRIGYAAGMAFYLASLYWLLLIPVPLADVWGPILGWLALAAFLALYPATWVWACWRLFPGNSAAAQIRSEIPSSGRETLEKTEIHLIGKSPLPPIKGKEAGISAPGPISAANWAGPISNSAWTQRAGWAVCAAAIWVALEMLVARFLSGFPWDLLGVSQYKLTPLIQIASFTGVYGVSFLVVWASASLLGAVVVIVRRPAMRSAWFGEIILPMAAVLVVYGSGYRRLVQPAPKAPELSIALVQPSIPQSLIWDPKESSNRFVQLLELSRQALTNKPDLLVWPESAIPKMVRWDEGTYRAVTDLARTNKVWMIVGSDDAEPRGNSGRETDFFFNSSFLVAPDGHLTAQYKKRNLVIFGEYVPLARWLPFLKYLTPIDGGFTPGDRAVPFELQDLKVKVSVLICFEDTFPHLAREYVSDDTDFLVNLTNNGWFDESAAQWQHAVTALFRAVENGVPLVRCANNGLTCWVDAGGRIRQFYESPGHGIYGAGFMIAHVPVLSPGQTREPTFYRRHGDLFGWCCVGITVLRLGGSFLKKRKPRDNAVLSES